MATVDPVQQKDPKFGKRRNTKTKWTDRLVAHSLMKNGMSTRKAAALVGVSQRTAVSIKNDPDLSPEMISQVKDSLPGMFYNLSKRAAGKISEEKLEKLDAYRLILTSKIAADAGRMCDGLPTRTVEVRSIALQVQGQLSSIRKRMQALGGVSPVSFDTSAQA